MLLCIMAFVLILDQLAIHIVTYNIYETNLTCDTPFQEPTRIVLVSVSINGIDFTNGSDFENNDLLFYYQNNVLLHKAIPPRGQITGNTIVTIYGINFENPTYCRFGDSSTDYITATVVNSTKITCKTPTAYNNNNGIVNIEVSNNLVDWTMQHLSWTYELIPTITKISLYSHSNYYILPTVIKLSSYYAPAVGNSNINIKW